MDAGCWLRAAVLRGDLQIHVHQRASHPTTVVSPLNTQPIQTAASQSVLHVRTGIPSGQVAALRGRRPVALLRAGAAAPQAAQACCTYIRSFFRPRAIPGCYMYVMDAGCWLRAAVLRGEQPSSDLATSHSCS